jgi:hypothetical protein
MILAYDSVRISGGINMQRRVGMFASVLIIIAIVACRTQTLSEEDDKKAAIAVVLAHELACQTYDFDKLDSLHTRDSRGIEESYPHPSEPDLRQSYQVDKDAGVHIDYHSQDAVAQVRGNVAWVTVRLHSVWTADSPIGRAMLGGNEWHATFVESHVLVKTPDGWKLALGHASMLPPLFWCRTGLPGPRWHEVSGGARG